MTNFSTNQVLQFYVTDTAELTKSLDGKIMYITDTAKTFKTDNITNVMSIKVVDAASVAKYGKKITLTASKVVKGEDYVVRVSYPEVGGLGVEGWTTKTAVAHATSTATSDLYEVLGEALQKALEVDGVLEATHSASGIVISNTFDPKMYKRGVRPAVMADFKVSTNVVDDEGTDLDWGVQVEAKNTSVAITSGYKYADMEYFAMGERGDQYRMMGYPDVIDTEYKIQQASNYDAAIIHYAYVGANDTSYKSEKDLIIVTTSKANLSSALKDLSEATGVAVMQVVNGVESVMELN